MCRVVELAAGTTDTSAAARIRTVVMRLIETDPETIEHLRATMPKYRDWLALVDGEPIGVGACTLIPGMEASAAAFAVNCVLPDETSAHGLVDFADRFGGPGARVRGV